MMTISPQTKNWLRQSAALDGAVVSQVLLHLLERVEALEQRPIPGFVDLAASAPEAAPVATDKKQPLPPHIAITYQPKPVYQPLAPQPPAAQPAPPVALSDALIKAECALSDIAEGLETNEAPNTFEWAEQHCAETLAIIRPVMKLHKIRTSEWPPQPLPQSRGVQP
jgi:hypothetical protein